MGNIHEVEWKQLTLGHLSRNKFWGEDPDTQYHSVVASSTLVRTGISISLWTRRCWWMRWRAGFKRYCGIDRKDIDIIFATHFHTDHRLDAEKYPNAKLYMSAESVREVVLFARGGRAFWRRHF